MDTIQPEFIPIMRLSYEVCTNKGANDAVTNAGLKAIEQLNADKISKLSDSEKQSIKQAFQCISRNLNRESKITILDSIGDLFRKMTGRHTEKERKEHLRQLKWKIDDLLMGQLNPIEQTEVKSPEEALGRFLQNDFKKAFKSKPESFDTIDLALIEIISNAFWSCEEVQNAPNKFNEFPNQYDVFKQLMIGFFNGSHTLIPEEKFIESIYSSLIKGAKNELEVKDFLEQKEITLAELKERTPAPDATYQEFERADNWFKECVFRPLMQQKMEQMDPPGSGDHIAERFSSHYGPVGRYRQFQMEGKAIPATLFDVGTMAEIKDRDGKTNVVAGIYYQNIREPNVKNSKSKNENMLRTWAKNQTDAGEAQRRILSNPELRPRRYVNMQTEGRPDWTIDTNGKYVFSFAGLAHRVFDFVTYQYRLKTNPARAQVGPYGRGGLPDTTPIRIN